MGAGITDQHVRQSVASASFATNGTGTTYEATSPKVSNLSVASGGIHTGRVSQTLRRPSHRISFTIEKYAGVTQTISITPSTSVNASSTVDTEPDSVSASARSSPTRSTVDADGNQVTLYDNGPPETGTRMGRYSQQLKTALLNDTE